MSPGTRERLTRYLAGQAAENQGVFGNINRLAEKTDVKKRGKKKSRFEPKQFLESEPSQPDKQVYRAIADAGLWTWDGNKKFIFRDLEAVRYLKGGWIEEHAAFGLEALFRELQLPAGHWGVGLEVRPNGARNREKPLNELDAAIVWKNRLLVIECKTSSSVDDGAASQDIGNKLEAIAHYIGGSFCTKWLASARRVGDNTVAADRFRHLGIEVLQGGDIPNLKTRIAAWMGYAVPASAPATEAPPPPKPKKGRPKEKRVPASSAMAEAFKRAQNSG